MWTERARPPQRPRAAHRPARGFTLIESIVAIVVVGAGLAGLLLVFQTTMRRSADPLLQRQMSAIASELLEEIQFKPFAAEANVAPLGCARDTYNDLADYHGYSSTGICMIDGVAIPELAGFNVSVSVTAMALSDVPAGDARRIQIVVTHGSDSFTLRGHRTHFAGP